MTLITFRRGACHSLDVTGYVGDCWRLQVPELKKRKTCNKNDVKFVPSDSDRPLTLD